MDHDGPNHVVSCPGLPVACGRPVAVGIEGRSRNPLFRDRSDFLISVGLFFLNSVLPGPCLSLRMRPFGAQNAGNSAVSPPSPARFPPEKRTANRLSRFSLRPLPAFFCPGPVFCGPVRGVFRRRSSSSAAVSPPASGRRRSVRGCRGFRPSRTLPTRGSSTSG